jgi:hypothetical protein
MRKVSFYGYFAMAFGTCWFVLLSLAVILQTHIDAGYFGLIGFPVISIIYASIMRRRKTDLEYEYEQLQRDNHSLRAELPRSKADSFFIDPRS